MVPFLQVFFFLFLLSFPLWAKPYTLSETIAEALKASPILSAEKEREKISDLDLTTRSRAFYPRLDLESSHGVGENKTPQTTDPWVSSLQLKITESLYDNGASWTKLSQGKKEREIARLNVERVRDDLIYQIIDRFYAYSTAQYVLEAVQAQKDLIDKQFNSVSQKFRQGLRTRRDFLRFKAQAQRMQLDTRAAIVSKEKARLELKRLVGVSPQQEIDFEIAQADKIQVQTTAETPKVEGTYEYKIAKGTTEARRYNVDLAKRRYWPEVNLVSSAYYNNNSYINSGRPFRDTEGHGWNILLQLNYNIWDWGERRREIEKAEASQLILDHETRKVEVATSAEIRSLMLDLKQAMENLSVSEDLLKAQTEAYDVIRMDYAEGRAEYQDLIESLGSLLDAKGRYFRSRFSLATLVSKKQYFEGSIYENYKN